MKTESMRGSSALATEDFDARYDKGTLLGSGGQGNIYRVYDRKLRRYVVMKVLDRVLATDGVELARFIQEAQLSAQLEHPAIVPVHDTGVLSDGRPYYTMTEVRGRTFATVMADTHAAGGGYRRLLDMFHRVCEAVGYAHANGVIHRDLKPQNIMVGAFGEVVVLDWGLARLVNAPEELSTIRRDSAAFGTEVGSVVGTRGYMPPEQLGGSAVGPASDVYALGMILREVLTGERVSLPMPIRRQVPAELVAMFERAVAPSPADRYPDATELARVVGEYLDGETKRARAQQLLVEARALLPAIAQLRERSAAKQREARGVLDALPPSADAALKEPGWALEDEARALAAESEMQTFRMTQLVASSLAEYDLDEAHALLADHYRGLHEAAERARDPAAQRYEAELRAHDRGAHAAYLAGAGKLTLHTNVPCEIEVRRYELRSRRLVDEPVRTLRSPVVDLELPHGSYLLVLRAAGHHEVRYPLAIERNEHWRAIRPGSSHPVDIVLPKLGTIGDDEIYVPGGPFVCGGDPHAAGEVMPRQRVWIDSFVMRRHPITNRELLEMVNALIDEGAAHIALDVVPRHRGTAHSEAGSLVWPRDANGHFELGGDDEGVQWEPTTPAFMVNWHGALQYAAWLSRRTGRPYRLPGELEHEKAARGADGRAFPWGNFFDPSWACMRLSREGLLRPVDVDEFPADESPYGVRGLAGNVIEWCADAYRREGPPVAGGLYTPPAVAATDAPIERTLRGGCFFFDSFLLRAATRHSTGSVVRDVSLGFRLVRSFGGDA